MNLCVTNRFSLFEYEPNFNFKFENDFSSWLVSLMEKSFTDVQWNIYNKDSGKINQGTCQLVDYLWE